MYDVDYVVCMDISSWARLFKSLLALILGKMLTNVSDSLMFKSVTAANFT